MEGDLQAFVDSLLGERIGGRYLVERAIRSGGMGVVAAGRYPELEQEVAIKFMRPELASNSVLSARFLREARLAARVRSPHFVRVFDFGKLDSGVPYLVMEMLVGRDLRDELSARGALPIEEAVDDLLQAMVGLAEVHALGIVHRDLKPSNLFMAEAGGTRVLKVLDFGVSKEKKESSDLTSTGNVVGTPHYMAPEQIKESRAVDVRSDVWALGVILYELLTTSLPYGGDGEAPGEVFGLVLHTDPAPPRERNADVPEAIETVIMKCLAREPEDRYADVGELADALAPFASAASRARIAAVHRVLSAPHPTPPEDRSSGKGRAAVRAPTAATAESSPSAKRTPSLGRGSPPPASQAVTTVLDEPPTRSGPETSITSTHSSGTMRKPVGSTRMLWLGAAIALVVAGGAFLATRTAAHPASAPPAAPAATAPLAPSPAVVPLASSIAPASPPLPSAAPVASATAPPPPARPPRARPRSAPAAASPSAPAPASDLILDRK